MSRWIGASLRLTLALALVACGAEPEAAAAPEPEVDVTPAPGTEADDPTEGEAEDQLGELAAGPVIVDPRFELRIEAEGPYATGEAGTMRVRLEPRGEYEVESRYPYRLVFHSADGLTLSSTELARRDATEISAERAIFDVDVTPARAGSFDCSVDVEFAVCSDIGCVPLERTLAWTLSAS